MTKEIWKDIKGCEGYQVSNLGSVRSVDRCILKGGRKINRKGKVLAQAKSNWGYSMITLHVDKIKTYSVHRLVAKAFLKNPLDKETVNHIDGNKLNNCVSNLEWNTWAENNNHAIRKGLNNVCRSVNQYTLDGLLIAGFRSAKEASDVIGCCPGNIIKACRGKLNIVSGFIWKYKED